MEDHYQLIFTGEVSGATSIEATQECLTSRFNLSGPVIDRLFSGGEVIVKNGVDYQTASKLKRAFEKAGALCRIQSNRPPRNITDLPATPQVARQVMAKTADPDVSAQELQKVIAADQQLAAKILRVANSSFYGGYRSVANLSDAIVLLGFKTIKNLVIASAVRSLCGHSGFVENLLWQHSVGCAIASQVIARKVKFPQLEEAFLAGLMHDIGKVVFQMQAPDEMFQVTQEHYNDPEYPLERVELERFGASHAEIGRQVAAKWHFPETIEQAIACHHNPGHSAHPQSLPDIANLADAICHKLEIGPVRNSSMDLAELASAKQLNLGSEILDTLMAQIGDTYETEKESFMM